MQLGISFQRGKTSGNRYINDVRFWIQRSPLGYKEKDFFFFFKFFLKFFFFWEWYHEIWRFFSPFTHILRKSSSK
jgi:hypothetical protein